MLYSIFILIPLEPLEDVLSDLFSRFMQTNTADLTDEVDG